MRHVMDILERDYSDAFNPETKGAALRQGGRLEMDGDLDDATVEGAQKKDRPRAKSLPAYPAQAELFDGLSQSCRKRVRFADSLGLCLTSVKHYCAADEPHVPSKVFTRLHSHPPPQLDVDLLDDLCFKFSPALSLSVDCLVPKFTSPVDNCDFDERLQRYKVSLERVSVSHFDIRGLVRVVDLGGKKEVGVRYTFNDWLTFVDTQAFSVTASGESTEQFSFTLYSPPLQGDGCSVHFAVYYRTDSEEFWDNNAGSNYTLEHRRAAPPE
ncbi:protein phosphatase 1 regulatory subunit 3G [Erpetoichthys calabaricus]|uniref:protein phosphatase 1 regulatory subunit 3G n=1 Tax=Erpetoichthys calabaricus TaxID=27687 RepID=UPI00109FD24B|nr:protein phosphatase 1 regulatory subunit 3G [Erpetoichthys calabaricus]